MENKTTQSSKSNEKRDPGFVKIRRGLLDHLAAMPGADVKLYLWLHLKARFVGARRGTVESNYAEIADDLGCNLKTVKRAMESLEFGRYIEVERAANQHERTVIKILKYDREDAVSGGDKNVPTRQSAGDIAKVDCVPSDVPSDVPSNSVRPHTTKNLAVPKNAVEGFRTREWESDAVRRPVNAELPATIPHLQKANPNSKPNSSASHRSKLEARLADKNRRERDCYSWWIAECGKRGWEHPYGAEEKAAFKALKYQPDLNSPNLTSSFVGVVVDVYDEHKDKGVTPGNLCSKVIDHCQVERKRALAIGGTADGYYWPPDFQDHRDRLRELECQVKQKLGQEVRA